jgi:hypothetical protein
LSDRRGYNLDGGTEHRPIRGEQEMELIDIGMLRRIGG